MNKILQFIFKNKFKKESFTVKLYRESVLINTITVPSGTTVNLSTYVPVALGGYVFNGWNTTNTYKVAPDYSSSGSITITKNMSLYASYHFTVDKYISGSLSSNNYAKGSSITLGSASKSPSYYGSNIVSNWSFYGWGTSYGTTRTYTYNQSVSTNTTVYAIFTGSYTGSSTTRVSNTINDSGYKSRSTLYLTFSSPVPNTSVSVSIYLNCTVVGSSDPISITVGGIMNYVKFVQSPCNTTFNVPAFTLNSDTVCVDILATSEFNSSGTYIQTSVSYSYDAITTGTVSVTSN